MTLLKQIAALAKQLKIVAGVITSVGIIAGATLWINSTSNNNQTEQTANFDRMFDSIAEVKQLSEWNNIEIGLLGERQEDFHDTLMKFEQEHKKQGENIETLGWAIKNINNVSPEMLEEILNRELKKNVSLKPDLDYDFPSWWIAEPNTDLILSSSRLNDPL